MPVLIFLFLAVIILAIAGAGAFPAVLLSTAAALCSLCTAVSIRNGHYAFTRLSLLAVGLVTLVLLTALPLPPCFDSLLNSQRAAQNRLARSAVKQAAETGLSEPVSTWMSVTRNRSGTLRTALLLISAFACGWLGSLLDAGQKMKYLKGLLIIVSLIAIAGFAGQWLVPQESRIWWFFDVPHGDPVGCFVNRNHFGGFLAMLAPAALILCINSMKGMVSVLFWGIIYTIVSIASLMSLSRGALVAWLAGMATVTAFTVLQHRKPLRKILCAACAFAFCATAVLTNSRTRDRVASLGNIQGSASARMRFDTWRDSLRILPDYALLGTGANGFRMIFPQYRRSSTRKQFKHAENEYIQVPVETGAAGILLIFAILFSTARRWLARARTGPPSDNDILLDTCVLGAVAAAAVHSMLDFAIRVPLYLVTLASLLGLTIAAPRETGSSENWKLPCIPVFFGLGLLLPVFLCIAGGTRELELDSPDYIKNAKPEDLCKALVHAPTSWHAWYHLGNAAIRSGLPGSYDFGTQCITQATEYDPLNYRLWEQLCRMRLHLHDTEGAQEAYRTLKKLRPWKKIRELEAK